MNCYNGERWLREAIDSVYGQIYPSWEIVFWDNASTDRGPEIARSYDARLRYFRGEATVPLGAARNLAVCQARGELLAFLDCDDVWLPQTLQRQVALMADSRFAAGYGGFATIDEDGLVVGRYVPTYRSGHLFDALLRQWDISVQTMVVRRSVLERTGLTFDARITASEEYCLFMQLAVAHEFGVINDVVAKYRVHNRALTNRSIARWWQERVYTLDVICQRYPGIRDRHRPAFDEAYARSHYYRARYLVARGEKDHARAAMRLIRFMNYRYFALYAMLFMPTGIWDWVHRTRTGRSSFSW